MKKKFIANLLFLVAINLLIKPFWFLGVEVGVQNHVSNADYGLFFTLFNLSLLFNIVLDFGITNFNNREIAKHNQLVTKYFSNVFLVKLSLGLVYLLVCLIAGIFAGYRNFSIILLLILAFNQLLASMILYLRSFINGMLMFVTDSLISVLDRTIMIAVCSIFLWTNLAHGRFYIQWFALIQTFAYSVTVIVAFIIVISKCEKVRFRADIKYFKIILRKSIPFSLLVVLMQLYSRMDPVFIERMLPDGAEQAGIYAYSFRIFDVLTNFAYLFPVLLLPIFSRLIKLKEDLRPILQLSAVLIWVFSITSAIACFYFRNDIMMTLYKNTKSSEILGIIIFGFIGMSTTFVFGTLLTANGNLRQLYIMAIISVLLNVGLNLILVPIYKAKGAAFACLSTQAFTAICQVLLTIRIMHVGLPLKTFFKLALFVCILIAAGFAALLIKPWYVGFGLVFLCSLIITFVLNLINPKDILKMFLSYETS